MLTTELQTRFARSCTDAAFGYAQAATAAYAAVATQTFEFWANAVGAASGAAAERPAKRETWFRETRPERDPIPATPFDFWAKPAQEFFKASNPWIAPPGNAAAQLAFSPITAWWSIFPLRGNPDSWPMAYGLMTAGVPSSVAWPTAQANSAAMDAADVATDALNSAFATYRSESGYAMAQVISPRQLMTALMLVPLGSAIALPWSLASRASGF